MAVRARCRRGTGLHLIPIAPSTQALGRDSEVCRDLEALWKVVVCDTLSKASRLWSERARGSIARPHERQVALSGLSWVVPKRRGVQRSIVRHVQAPWQIIKGGQGRAGDVDKPLCKPRGRGRRCRLKCFCRGHRRTQVRPPSSRVRTPPIARTCVCVSSSFSLSLCVCVCDMIIHRGCVRVAWFESVTCVDRSQLHIGLLLLLSRHVATLGHWHTHLGHVAVRAEVEARL